MIFLLPGFLIAVGCAVFVAVKKKAARLPLLLAALIAAIFIAYPLFFLIGLDGANQAVNAVRIGIGALIVLFILGLALKWWNRRRAAALAGAFLLLIGARWGLSAYEDYEKSITVPEGFDYREYLPTPDNPLVARLDEPAALRLEGENPPRMDGATALYPLYAAFARAVYPETLLEDKSFVRAHVDCSTTSFAYEKIIRGDADVIFAAGPSAEQEKHAAEQGVELIYTPIGREAFVFFVNPANPVGDLSLDEIRGIYSGNITKWDQLGVKGLGSILAFQRSEGSGSQTALERFVMGDTPLMEAPKENVSDGMGDIVEQVSSYRNHRNAIGYSFRFYCTALIKGFDVKLLSVNGVAPTAENIENGAYPLASYFYAVTRSDAGEDVKALAEWVAGPQGQALVEKVGYVPAAAR